MTELKRCVGIRWCLILLALSATTTSDILKDQMVTYADFNYVNSISSSFKHVYFATTEGITRFNKMTLRWEDPLTGGEGLGSEQVLQVFVDEFDTRLYAETPMGLFEFDSLFDRWYFLTELPMIDNSSVHVKLPATMFMPPGFHYPGDGRLIDPDGRYFSITDMLDDGDGNLWLGTWGYGAANAATTSNMIELMPFGLIQKHVNTIYEYDGRLWMAGAAIDASRTGVTVFDRDNNAFSYVEPDLFNDFPVVDVNCLAVNERTLFLGTTEGLLYLDRTSERVTRRLSTFNGLPHDNVYSLELVGDSLFVGTEEGLALAPVSGDSVSYVLPGRFNLVAVYDLKHIDSLLWVATSEGAFRLHLESGRWHQFVDPDRVLTGDVYSIASWRQQIVFAAPDGVVWADGLSGEVQLLHQTERRHSPVVALAINETIVAAASSDGLTLIYYTDDRLKMRQFTTLDGLPSDYLYDLLLDGDYVWIGSDEGLTRFWWNNPSRVD